MSNETETVRVKLMSMPALEAKYTGQLKLGQVYDAERQENERPDGRGDWRFRYWITVQVGEDKERVALLPHEVKIVESK